MALSKKAMWWTAGLLIALLTVAGVAYSAVSKAELDRATVLQVIDGDTVDVTLHGERTRVRLLNVDTPETKHPNEIVQCMGPEATEFLEELLPVGAQVDLEFDVEREDKYGRTLAGIFRQDELVNAQIAAEGFGVAVLYEPNDKFYSAVKEAETQARNEQRGLFDPVASCSLPYQIEQLQEQIQQFSEDLPQDTAGVDDELDLLLPYIELVDDYLVLIALPGSDKAKANGAAFLAYVYEGQQEAIEAQLKGLSSELADRKTQLEEAKAEIEAEEEERRRLEEQRKKEEQERKRQEEERERQEAEAAERQRQQAAEAQREQAAEDQRRQAEADAARERPRSHQGNGSSGGSAPAPSKTSSPNRNNVPSGYGTDADYPGYTGPRCYAPGGQSWKPC